MKRTQLALLIAGFIIALGLFFYFQTHQYSFTPSQVYANYHDTLRANSTASSSSGWINQP